MAQEPLTIFARIADPAAVARRLREMASTVELDGPDDAWRNAVITFWRVRRILFWRRRGKKCSLTFTHSPEYYAEPNWSRQMDGLHGYLSGFPETESKWKALALTTSLKFALGTLFEPDFDPDGDPRLDIVFQIVELLDGIIFTPASLRDAAGRILFSAGGEDQEHPEAQWPRVIGQLSLDDPVAAAAHEASRPKSVDEQSEEADPPSAERVARRALALTAVTVRAMLELEPPSAARVYTQRDLLAWVREIDLGDELEPDEWEVLQRPTGYLAERQQIDSTWRLEGLVVLAWALGLFDIPPHDRLVKPRELWQQLGLYDKEASLSLLASPTLRSRSEIATLRNRQFAIHWRLRNFHVHGDVLDFAEFARTCWFGPLDITGLPLVKGDLGLGRKRLDRAKSVALLKALSTAQERHHAANWLWEGPERYSEVRSDT